MEIVKKIMIIVAATFIVVMAGVFVIEIYKEAKFLDAESGKIEVEHCFGGFCKEVEW